MYKNYTSLLRSMSYVPKKILLVMKLTLVLLTVLGLQMASASSFAQISLNKTNAKLETVLAELIKETDASAVFWNRRYDPPGIAIDKDG
mgnify:CR=1 FL=1